MSSANINTGEGEGPVRDVFRVTDGEGKKVRGSGGCGGGVLATELVAGAQLRSVFSACLPACLSTPPR